MIEIQAPKNLDRSIPQQFTVFLAGSIEKDAAERWQAKVVEVLKDSEGIILNPRRDDWDNSWAESIDCPQFVEQVKWEYGGLGYAHLVVFYFDPNTKSPISLLEFGFCMHQQYYADIIVCCPDGFWKKGNIDVLCSLSQTKQVDTLEDLTASIKSCITEYNRFK